MGSDIPRQHVVTQDPFICEAAATLPPYLLNGSLIFQFTPLDFYYLTSTLRMMYLNLTITTRIFSRIWLESSGISNHVLGALFEYYYIMHSNVGLEFGYHKFHKQGCFTSWKTARIQNIVGDNTKVHSCGRK